MLKYIFKINLLLLFLASVLSAEIIEDVKIKGNKRLSKESIMVFGQINLNKDYNQNDLNEVLKKIYESNFFKNVNLQVVNSILN